MAEINFGLLEPSDEVKNLINAQPPVPLRAVTAPIEVDLPLPPEWLRWYDQGRHGACVGFAWSMAQSTNNVDPISKTWPRYDALTCYYKAQMIDGDPRTTPQRDNGTFLWAGAEVAKRFGMVDYKYAPLGWQKINKKKLYDPAAGIIDYWWVGRNIDAITSVFAEGKPPIFGIVVFEGMLKPTQKPNGERWFKPTGRPLGLHAIMGSRISYEREGVFIPNSWGRKWKGAWVKFEDLEFILQNHWGEVMVGLDVPNPAVGALSLYREPEDEQTGEYK